MSDDLHELSVTRYIAAPPEAVWKAMTERQDEWWCPRPWTSETIAQERRPGGRWAFVMRGPNGEEDVNDGIILAWDEGRRFVATDAVTHDFRPAGPFMIGFWEIEPEGDGTRYTGRARHWTAEARRKHEEMGFTEGWGACADQLASLVEGVRA